MAMDQAGLGLCHALCGPLAAHHEVHHGLGNAVLLPAVLAFNAEAIAPVRWPALRNAVGLPAQAGPDALPVWALRFPGRHRTAHKAPCLGFGRFNLRRRRRRGHAHGDDCQQRACRRGSRMFVGVERCLVRIS